MHHHQPILQATGFSTAVSTLFYWSIAHNLHVVPVSAFLSAVVGFITAKGLGATWDYFAQRITKADGAIIYRANRPIKP